MKISKASDKLLDGFVLEVLESQYPKSLLTRQALIAKAKLANRIAKLEADAAELRRLKKATK